MGWTPEHAASAARPTAEEHGDFLFLKKIKRSRYYQVDMERGRLGNSGHHCFLKIHLVCEVSKTENETRNRDMDQNLHHDQILIFH